MTDSHSHFGARIVKGMIVIIFFGLFLKLGGFLMSLIVSRYYGLGDVTASYMQIYTFVIYMVVYSTLLQVVMPAFMPLFSEARNRDGEEQAWRFASSVVNGVVLIGVLLAIGAFLFSGSIIQALVPGFGAERQQTAASMLRWMSPGIAVFVFAVVAMGILNSYKIFSFPSAGEAAQKLCWAVAIFILIVFFDMDRGAAAHRPIVLGFLFGCAVQATILLVGLMRRRSPYKPGFPALSGRRLGIESAWLLGALALFALWSWGVSAAPAWFEDETAKRIKDNSGLLVLTGALAFGWAYAGLLWIRCRKATSYIGRFALLAAPLLIGVLFSRYRDLVGAYFQSHTEGGDFAVIELAKKIVNLPTILVAISLSVAMFPFLCDLAAREDKKAFGTIFGRTIRMIGMFFVPLTLVTIVCGRPVMRLVFDSGAWTDRQATQAGLALAIYSAGLFFYAIDSVLMQTYFSMQKVVIPTILGMVMAVLYVGALYLVVEVFGYSSPEQIFLVVLIAFPVTRTVKNLVLMGLIRFRVDTSELGSGLVYFGRLVLVTLATGAAAWGALSLARSVTNPDRWAPRFAIVDTFNPEDEESAARLSDMPDGGRGIEYWEAHPEIEMGLDTLGQTDKVTERALHFPVRAGARRRLGVFEDRLEGMTRLAFKAKTPVDRDLSVVLSTEAGQAAANVPIEASQDRKEYAVPLDAFQPSLPAGARLTSVAFADASADIAAPLWLDNIAFAKPVGFASRLRFEAAKGLRVLLPGLAATAAFVVVCVILRVEEFRIILDWARNRILKRRKPTNSAPPEGAQE